jgi:hypothetical protein
MTRGIFISKVEITTILLLSSLQAEMPEKNLAHASGGRRVAQLLNDQVEIARVSYGSVRAHYYGGRLKEAAQSTFGKVLCLDPQLLEDPELASLLAR